MLLHSGIHIMRVRTFSNGTYYANVDIYTHIHTNTHRTGR